MESNHKIVSKNGIVLCEECGHMLEVGFKDYIERELDNKVLGLTNEEEGKFVTWQNKNDNDEMQKWEMSGVDADGYFTLKSKSGHLLHAYRKERFTNGVPATSDSNTYRKNTFGSTKMHSF